MAGILVFLEHHGSELQKGSLGVLSKAASLGGPARFSVCSSRPDFTSQIFT